jgi:hypothetical protein
MSIIDRRRLPASLRGDVELVIGEPMWFDAETDHAAATTRLEAAVAALRARSPSRRWALWTLGGANSTELPDHLVPRSGGRSSP